MVAAIVSTIVYVVGTVLYGVLTGLVLRRRQKTWSEIILLLLGLSAAVWYLGNALDRFAFLLFTERPPDVITMTDVICCLGIALVPSLLMIMALLYLHEHRRPVPRWLLATLIAAFCVLPLPFSLVLVGVISGEARLASVVAQPIGQVFLGWLALSLISSAWVCFRQTRQATDKQDEGFFRILFWATVAVAVAIVASPLLTAPRAPGGPWGQIDVLVSLGGLFPGMVFAYYVYRYNYLEFILRRGLLHGFLTLLVIGAYYFLILKVSAWLGVRVPRLNLPLVQALLVIALVYTFPHIGRTVRDLLRFLAFRRTADAEYRLDNLNREISADAMLDPERLFRDVCTEIAEACRARNVSMVLQTDSRLDIHGDPAGRDGFGEADFAAIAGVCADSRSPWLDSRDVRDVPCLSAMRKLGAQSVYPVVHEGGYHGFIALGRTPRMMPLTEGASQQLVVTANRVSAAMSRARMVRDQLELQRDLYAKEKFTALGRLAASVAHEVRNPLSSIKSLVQCLAEELAQKGMEAEETDLIVGEINRLNRTVSGLLRYARPAQEGGDTDFREELDTLLQLVRHELDRRGCRTQVEAPDDLPPVRAGQDEVKEVLLNLIFNALEAMPGGGLLTISARVNGDRMAVRITDTGTGIPADAQEKVFEPSFTTKEGGTGLGLSIVRERMQQMGGSIRCTSSSEGTTMELDMPLA